VENIRDAYSSNIRDQTYYIKGDMLIVIRTDQDLCSAQLKSGRYIIYLDNAINASSMDCTIDIYYGDYFGCDIRKCMNKHINKFSRIMNVPTSMRPCKLSNVINNSAFMMCCHLGHFEIIKWFHSLYANDKEMFKKRWN
jgi:hypothetical protein